MAAHVARRDDLPEEVRPALSGIRWPADRSEILHAARRNEASDAVLNALRRLPARRFGSRERVVEAVREVLE